MEAQRTKASGGAIAGPIAAATSEFEPLLSIADVAELLKLPRSWVYEHTRRRGFGRIPGFRLGKYWRFHRVEVLEWLEKQRIGARPNA
jgi:excisionase family DNA binding protein